MLKQLTVLCVSVFFVLVMGLHTYSRAGSEKGTKKCSDTIDNDGDGLVDGDDPDCGADGGSGGIGVLQDTNGVTIGKVVRIYALQRPEVHILFERSGQLFGAAVQDTRTVGRPIEQLAGFQINSSVFFDNSGCTGNAWIRQDVAISSSFFSEFIAAWIVGDPNNDPDERRLYMPSSNVSETRTVNSQMGLSCVDSTETLDLLPAILLDPDLHTTHPKPYSLILN